MSISFQTFDSGKKLYELFWGIKQQMEKGPQDALTLDARYSLSEEKLLRSTFDYNELTVFVSCTDSVYTQNDMAVRVLDCDTITQVKEKCLDVKYRGYRFSDRPSAQDLELEWKTGSNGKMTLQVGFHWFSGFENFLNPNGVDHRLLLDLFEFKYNFWNRKFFYLFFIFSW